MKGFTHMKKSIIGSCLTLAVSALSIAPAMAHNNACKPVWEACSAKVGKGKPAFECMKTIKHGGTVDGVTVSDADAKACAAAPDHHHGKDKPAAPADSSGANPS
jgi:hypothetical protein